MSQNKQFKTQDLNLSAVLIAKGFNLQEVLKSPNNRATFCFYSHNDMDKVINDYWNNNLFITPQELFNALKLLKNRIYSTY